MDIAATINQYKYKAFQWRYEASLVEKLALALGMACLTGLVAQFKIPLPWSPVPITGQAFAVLLAGVLLGRWWGGISQGMYVGIGAVGVSWFAGWKGGIGVLAGPTGGYLLGFILAALFVGHFTDRHIRARYFFPMLGLMLFANFILIHGPGLLQLYGWFFLVRGEALGLWPLLWMGTIPFIPGDVTKAVAAALIVRGGVPKQAYNGEVDVEKAKRWRIP